MSVLVTAMAAVALQRWALAARPRLKAFTQPLLDRIGAKAAQPRRTDRKRLEEQLRTWQQAHPDHTATRSRTTRAAH